MVPAEIPAGDQEHGFLSLQRTIAPLGAACSACVQTARPPQTAAAEEIGSHPVQERLSHRLRTSSNGCQDLFCYLWHHSAIVGDKPVCRHTRELHLEVTLLLLSQQTRLRLTAEYARQDPSEDVAFHSCALLKWCSVPTRVGHSSPLQRCLLLSLCSSLRLGMTLWQRISNE